MSTTEHVFRGVARRHRRKKILLTSGEGYSTVADGFDLADLVIKIDVAKIIRDYGWKAMANKSGRSTYMDGAIVMLASNIRKEVP